MKFVLVLSYPKSYRYHDWRNVASQSKQHIRGVVFSQCYLPELFHSRDSCSGKSKRETCRPSRPHRSISPSGHAGKYIFTVLQGCHPHFRDPEKMEILQTSARHGKFVFAMRTAWLLCQQYSCGNPSEFERPLPLNHPNRASGHWQQHDSDRAVSIKCG